MLISTSKAAPPSSIGIAADTRSANGLRCGFTGNAFAPRSFTVLRIMLDAPKPATKSLQPTEQSYGRWHVLPSALVSDQSYPALCSLQSEKTTSFILHYIHASPAVTADHLECFFSQLLKFFFFLFI